jgi:purine-binding chemotaxis protein CheW
MKTRGLLAFTIGGVGFGATVDEVAGVVEAERLSPLPRQREPLAGVVAFRGGMVPTLDLSSYLGLEPMPADGRRYALVLTRGADRFGVLIPQIPRLYRASDLQEADAAAPSDDPELSAVIDGVFEAEGTRIHCLNYWAIAESVVPASGA